MEKTAAHLKLQTIENQRKLTEGGVLNLPPSVPDPAYTHSD